MTTLSSENVYFALSQFCYPEINNKHSRNIEKIIAKAFSQRISQKATKLGKGEQQISMQFPQKYLSETKMFSKHFLCSLAKIESTFVCVRPAIE
jgi:hypothetical protein